MGENERGHSHGLDTITYGSTVKKSKSKGEKQEHSEETLGKTRGKSLKEEMIMCVKAAQRSSRRGFEKC